MDIGKPKWPTISELQIEEQYTYVHETFVIPFGMVLRWKVSAFGHSQGTIGKSTKTR